MDAYRNLARAAADYEQATLNIRTLTGAPAERVARLVADYCRGGGRAMGCYRWLVGLGGDIAEAERRLANHER